MQSHTAISTSVSEATRITRPRVTESAFGVHLPHRMFVKVYTLLSPLTYVLSPLAIAPLPLLYLVITSLTPVVWRQKLILRSSDLLLFTLVISGLIAAVPNPSIKVFNHLSAITASVLFYFIVVRSMLDNLSDINLVGKYFRLSLLFVSTFVIVDALATNLFQFDIHQFIPNSGINAQVKWTIFNGEWHRARGIAEEPGHTALFFELALPLSIIGLKRIHFGLILFYAFAFCAYFLLFSSASIAAFIASLIIFSLLVGFWEKGLMLRISMVLFIVIASVAFVPEIRAYADNTVAAKLSGLLDDSGQATSSAHDRRSRFAILFRIAKERPFGLGWGRISSLSENVQYFQGVQVPGSFISLYGDFFAATGLVGMLSFVLFQVSKISRLVVHSSRASKLTLIALLSLSMHYVVVGNFWYPWLWFAFALADTVILKTARKTKGRI